MHIAQCAQFVTSRLPCVSPRPPIFNSLYTLFQQRLHLQSYFHNLIFPHIDLSIVSSNDLYPSQSNLFLSLCRSSCNVSVCHFHSSCMLPFVLSAHNFSHIQ